MSRSTERTEVAIAAVAKHFRAACGPGTNSQKVYLTVGGKRVALEVVAVASRASRAKGAVPPRLRFDRVVLELFARLRRSLIESVPEAVTVLVTVTAPIRLSTKTAAVLIQRIRVLLAKQPARAQFSDIIHDNQVQVRIRRGAIVAGKVAAFVHNRDSDPSILFDLSETLLRSAASIGRTRTKAADERWLVVVHEEAALWDKTYQHVCAQLFAQTVFQRILIVGPRGQVAVAQLATGKVHREDM